MLNGPRVEEIDWSSVNVEILAQERPFFLQENRLSIQRELKWIRFQSRLVRLKCGLQLVQIVGEIQIAARRSSRWRIGDFLPEEERDCRNHRRVAFFERLNVELVHALDGENLTLRSQRVEVRRPIRLVRKHLQIDADLLGVLVLNFVHGNADFCFDVSRISRLSVPVYGSPALPNPVPLEDKRPLVVDGHVALIVDEVEDEDVAVLVSVFEIEQDKELILFVGACIANERLTDHLCPRMEFERKIQSIG